MPLAERITVSLRFNFALERVENFYSCQGRYPNFSGTPNASHPHSLTDSLRRRQHKTAATILTQAGAGAGAVVAPPQPPSVSSLHCHESIPPLSFLPQDLKVKLDLV
jgi:hypothetical protein